MSGQILRVRVCVRHFVCECVCIWRLGVAYLKPCDTRTETPSAVQIIIVQTAATHAAQHGLVQLGTVAPQLITAAAAAAACRNHWARTVGCLVVVGRVLVPMCVQSCRC